MSGEVMSLAICAVSTFAILATLFTHIETLAVFLDTSSFSTITSFPCGSFLSKVDRRSHDHIINCFRSDLTELLSILAAFTVTSLAEGTYQHKSMKLPCAKHSQYSLRHLDFLQLHLVCVCE